MYGSVGKKYKRPLYEPRVSYFNEERPIDPAYQYRDTTGKTSTRRFAPEIGQHRYHPRDEYYVKEPDEVNDHFERNCIYVFIAVAAILLILVVALTIIFGTGIYYDDQFKN